MRRGGHHHNARHGEMSHDYEEGLHELEDPSREYGDVSREYGKHLVKIEVIHSWIHCTSPP